LVDVVRSQTAADRFAATGDGDGAVLLDLDGAPPAPPDSDQWRSLPFVVVGVGRSLGDWQELVDVVLDRVGPDIDAVAATIGSNPIAATTLALLLRESAGRSVAAGLIAESAAYSTLQAGPEFARWRAERPRRQRDDDDLPRVRTRRDGSHLEITLTRPDARNALDVAMRDALHDALLIAALDSEVARVDLAGDGPAFCAGGDLDEMGRRIDPASAHLIRLHRSPARLLSNLAPRTTAHLHGACAGSGIELPAFADRVLAAPDTAFSLPEIGLGLVPGAGGTVSLPARIGRHRTAWLALTGRTIDAPSAVAWGLADDIAMPGHSR